MEALSFTKEILKVTKDSYLNHSGPHITSRDASLPRNPKTRQNCYIDILSFTCSNGESNWRIIFCSPALFIYVLRYITLQQLQT